MKLLDNFFMQNLHIFSGSKEYLDLLKSFSIVEEGYFEYKGKASDGTRYRGEYFVNFRRLTTAQEIALTPLYWKAIQEFFSDKLSDIIIVGVAFGSLSLPKVIQTLGFEKYGIEYAYTEKRNGVLGLFGEQAEKCRGKHILFIEDVLNNGTSCAELVEEVEKLKSSLGILGYSILYGVHRGHRFLETPKDELYTMGMIHAPVYHKDNVPLHVAERKLKEYKK